MRGHQDNRPGISLRKVVERSSHGFERLAHAYRSAQTVHWKDCDSVSFHKVDPNPRLI